VVEAELGDDRNVRINDVSGVKCSSDADLENHEVTSCLLEFEEGDHGCYLEECYVEVGGLVHLSQRVIA